MSKPQLRADLQDGIAVAISFADGLITAPSPDDHAHAHDHAPWRFARSWLSLNRFHGLRDATDLARAVADFDALPVQFSGRAKLASLLLSAHLDATDRRKRRHLAVAQRLAEAVRQDPRPLPGWSATYMAWTARRLTPPARVQQSSTWRERLGTERSRGTSDALPELIAVTAELIEVLDPVDGAPWLFARAWMSTLRFDHLDGDTSDLDRALADFERLPEWFPGRPKLAGVIVMAQMHHWVFGDEKRFAPAITLAAVADQDPSPLPNWDQLYALLCLADGLAQIHNHGAAISSPALLEQLERAEALLVDYPDAVELVQMAATMRMGLTSFTAHEFHDVDRLQEAMDIGRQARASGREAEPALYELLFAAFTAAAHSDYGALRAQLPQIEQAARAAFAEELEPEVAVTLRLLRMLAEQGGRIDVRTGQVIDAETIMYADDPKAFTATDYAAQTPHERAAQAGIKVHLMLPSNDPAVIDQAVALADEVLAEGAPADEVVRIALSAAGTAYLRRFQLRRDPQDLVVAVTHLEQLMENLGSLFHPMAMRMASYLVLAYRLSGRTQDVRRVTTGALRGYSWNVLLQSRPADMQSVVASAGLFAETAARMYLDERDPVAAAAALESCRGLILYGALESRTLDVRLAARGEYELAAQWRAAAADEDIPTDLRRRAVAALAGVTLAPDGLTPLDNVPSIAGADADVRLLDPPDLHEIRAALRSQGMDALVYLMPDGQGPGGLVVIPIDDEPMVLPLPLLKIEDTAAFERFLVAGARAAVHSEEDPGPVVEGTEDHFAGRDVDILDLDFDPDDPDQGATGLGPTSSSGGEDGWTPKSSRSTVDRICSWAWKAAIGPLTGILPRPTDRPVRVVLIPMRELSRIPWHAARHTVDGRDRYAVQDYVFSYAASARMFCETAWRPGTTADEAGLVVGDPDTLGRARDLPGARAEAAAIRDQFYSSARYVGRAAVDAGRTDGPGTPQELREWLADPNGGSVLHLACHGVVRLASDAGATAYLLLDGGRQLSAEELLSTPARPPGRGVALAVLAACNSDRTGRGYDEAFSLATAFLAQGVGSAISAQWSVPDNETSVLMFMLHHYVRAEGLGPLDALHAAQLWMLSDRIPPATMPESLRALIAARHGEPSVAAWAAFVHTGKA